MEFPTELIEDTSRPHRIALFLKILPKRALSPPPILPLACATESERLEVECLLRKHAQVFAEVLKESLDPEIFQIARTKIRKDLTIGQIAALETLRNQSQNLENPEIPEISGVRLILRAESPETVLDEPLEFVPGSMSDPLDRCVYAGLLHATIEAMERSLLEDLQKARLDLKIMR